jgi:hypothetical protein
VTLVLQALDDVDLVGREDVGVDVALVDADLARDVERDGARVAGEEDRSETELAQSGDRLA